MGESGVVGGCICFGIVLIISSILFGCSFAIINVEEWGLKYNMNNQSIGDETYGSGRYFVGLGKKFILFPRNFVGIDIRNSDEAQSNTLSCWTKDGLNVYIDLSFYVKLNQDKLRPLYYSFGETWYASILRISQASVKDVTTNYVTSEFFDNRESIASSIFDEMQNKFDEYSDDSIRLVSMQLRDIRFETEFEEAVTNKLIQMQYKKTALINQEMSTILKETELITTRASNDILEIEAEAEADGIMILAEANANYFKSLVNASTTSYKALFIELGITNSDEKLKFIYANEMIKQGGKMFVGFDSTLVTQ